MIKNKPIASPKPIPATNLLRTEYEQGVIKGRSQGFKIKLVSFIIWTLILITASLVLGMGIGSKAIVSRGDAYLKAEVARLTEQNTKLKVENYELRDIIRGRDMTKI